MEPARGRPQLRLAARPSPAGPSRKRAPSFEALSGFQTGLRADVPPQDVLQAVAQTAVGVLGVPTVAAFSLPPGRTFAEALMCNEAGTVIETSLIDLPGSTAPQAAPA